MVAAAIVGVAILGLALDVATASPRLCGVCHEMATRAGSWSESPHGGIVCVTCHQTPRPWYAVPVRLADRARLLVRDVSKHLAGGYRDPVDGRVSGAAAMPDDVCLQCHDPNRKATSGFRILIDHAAHATRNKSCVSCHVRTAHPVETRGAALSLMGACFTCHGTATTAKASGRCGLCHPSDYKLVPASHTPASWKLKTHGGVARSDLKQCEMCHEKSACDGCHGLEMPHP
ncbi:MAG TPA: cytochrome c3 family protein, partial [Coriobacteriia bacterium]